MRSLTLALGGLLFAAASPAGAAPLGGDPIATVGKLAMNLSEHRDWTPARVFTDAMKAGRPWVSQNPGSIEPWDNGAPLALDANGWPLPQPGQSAATVIFRDTDGAYPAGLYNVYWEGSGVLEVGYDPTLAVHLSPTHAQLDVVPDVHGIVIKIKSTDLVDPIRNIRVVLPGFEQTFTTQVFHPDFLEAMEPFGALRFMQWQNTNFNTLVDWADRPTRDHFSQATELGVSVEHMVDLCNLTQKSAWFCMPALASDDFVRQFARYVAQNLNPGEPAFIEYANEVWNGSYLPYSHALASGQAAGLPGTPFEQGMRWYSERSVEIFEIWRQEFEAVSGSGWSDRLVRVMAAQHGNTFTSELVLDHNQAYLHCDAHSVAPYFGFSHGEPGNINATLGKTNEQIIDELKLEIQTSLATKIADNVAIANQRGLPLIAYEGGQHMVALGAAASNQFLIQKLASVNRSPGMYDVYRDYLDVWEQSGAGFMTPFSFVSRYDVYGSFGHKEYLGQPLGEAPKHRALLEYIGLPTGEAVEYGSGCAGLNLGHLGFPQLGVAGFSATLTGAPSGVPAALHISGLSDNFYGIPLPLDLTFSGADGCQLLVGQPSSLFYVTNPAGNILAPLTIPNNPALAGVTVYLQWTANISGFGLLELGFSEALAVTIAG